MGDSSSFLATPNRRRITGSCYSVCDWSCRLSRLPGSPTRRPPTCSEDLCPPQTYNQRPTEICGSCCQSRARMLRYVAWALSSSQAELIQLVRPKLGYVSLIT